MSRNAWDRAWSQGSATGLWSLPDPDVEALIPRRHDEGVLRVLDLGCGTGRHTVLFAAAGFETHATDLSAQGVERCRTWLQTEGLYATISVSSMAALAYPDSFFGFVVSWNVVYHAVRTEIISALAEVHRVTRKDGLFYLTLNSTRNTTSVSGTEIEPYTYNDPGRGWGHHLHHYSDEGDARSLLSAWRIEQMTGSGEWLGGQVCPGTWHWLILARRV